MPGSASPPHRPAGFRGRPGWGPTASGGGAGRRRESVWRRIASQSAAARAASGAVTAKTGTDRRPAGGGSGLERIGDFLIRRARLVVVLWLLLTALLALQGVNLEKKLSVQPIYIGGTTTKQEHELSLREFGNEDALVVMLRGPARAVQSQGHRLNDRLEAIQGSLVVAPWTPGAALGGLSPSPRVAALLVSLPHRSGESPAAVSQSVQHLVEESVGGPVRASLSGGPALTNSLQNAIGPAAKTGELIAIPVLLLVLLFVFRSVLAAAVPVAVGGAVVAATRGVLDQLLGVVQM